MREVIKNVFVKTVLFGAMSTLVVGCSTATESSDSVDQTKIHQTYSANYEEENNRTSVTAGYRFGDGGGTTLRLVGKSVVTHNIYPLREAKMMGTFYSGDGAGFQPTHVFTWRDANGKEFVNSATISSIKFAPSFSTAMSPKTGGAIPFVGAIQPGESVSVYIHDAVRNLSKLVSSRKAGETSLTVTSDDLAKFFAGKVTFELKRQQISPLQQGTERGGFISTSYVTLKREVTFTP
jgi:hypothetical protein